MRGKPRKTKFKLNRALEKAALRRIRFRDLRYTFASRLLQNGESVVSVKDHLGPI